MESTDRQDEALGLNTSISRRDFLNGALISMGAVWTSHLSPMQQVVRAQQTTTQTSRSSWGGNSQEAFDAGHAVRDGLYDDPAIAAEDTGEVFDLVVVGGGFSGLAAAYYFNQAKAGRGQVKTIKCLVAMLGEMSSESRARLFTRRKGRSLLRICHRHLLPLLRWRISSRN